MESQGHIDILVLTMKISEALIVAVRLLAQLQKLGQIAHGETIAI